MSRLILLLSFFIGTQALFCQSSEDFGVWVGGKFSKKLNKDFDAIGQLGFRSNDNSRHLKQFFYQIGAKTKLIGAINVSLAYRNRFLFDYYEKEVEHRLLCDISYKFKWKKLSVQLRNRLQYTYSFDEGPLVERLRIKPELKLNKQLRVYVLEEVFIHLNNFSGIVRNKNRWGLGLKYKINKDLALNMSYLRSVDKNQQAPKAINAIRLKFSYDL